MKKKIIALLAAVATLLGFGFAADAAMAGEYGETATISGNVASLSYPAGTFTPNAPITVTADDTYVSDVQLVAMKEFHPGNANADGSANLKYILTDAALKTINDGGAVTLTVSDGTTSVTTELTSANIPATGDGSSDSGTGTGTGTGAGSADLSDTGAAIAPPLRPGRRAAGCGRFLRVRRSQGQRPINRFPMSRDIKRKRLQGDLGLFPFEAIHQYRFQS